MVSLREQAQRLKKRRPRDFDPEDDPVVERDDSSSDDETQPAFGGREHYGPLSNSKLRRPEHPQLGEKYQGVAVSRIDIQANSDDDPFGPVDEEDEDDPFARRQDPDEISEDLQEEDEVMPDDADQQSGSEMESGSHSDIEMNEDDADDSDTTSISSQSSSTQRTGHAADRKALLDLMKKDTARVAATLSSSEDAKQGNAVRQQKSASDRLLDARMKFQKGLTTANNISADFITDAEARDAIEKAEAAAVSLWSTLDSIRAAFLSVSSAGKDSQRQKRERPTPLELGPSPPFSTVWKHSQALETTALPHRRNTLNHWSLRIRPIASSHPSRSKNHNTPKDPNLTDVLDEYLSRDSAKLIASSTSTSDHEGRSTNINFSDDSFYQSLLRDLIASRTEIPISTTATATSQSKPTPMNNQRNRRNVDTKASKGRKIRYTVHEKLVSFMAPEDRSTWSDSARGEFFGSLFGGTITNGEIPNEDTGWFDYYNDTGQGNSVDEAPLRLFQK